MSAHSDSTNLPLENWMAILERYITLMELLKVDEPPLAFFALSKDYDQRKANLEQSLRNEPTRPVRLVVDFWRRLSNKMWLRPEVHLRILPSILKVDPIITPQPWDVCSQGHCLCSTINRCHQMKVCKGCWKVKYCCKKCQKV